MSEDVRRVERVSFPGISSRAYEHPVDRGALATLRTVPGFAQVLKALFGFFTERGLRLSALSSTIRVAPEQYPELDRLRNECAATLDLPTVPTVYVMRDPNPDSFTIGLDEPFIVLTTGLVDMADAEGLRFAIGHEMGHVLSGHAVYRTMMIHLLELQRSLSWNPISGIGLRAILAALHEWFRKAELSCDRAGLLCSQNPAAALRLHIQLAGGIDPDTIDIPSFLRQAEEYDGVDDLRDSLLKLRGLESMTHPLAVVRAAELHTWAGSDEYRAMLAGEYPRRDDDEPHSAWRDDIKAAARSYQASWSESADPLTKVFADVGTAVTDVAGKVRDRFGNRGSASGSQSAGSGESDD